MHELALCQAIAAVVRPHADSRHVDVVRVRVGALRQVVPDALAFCWTVVRDFENMPDAELEVEVVAAVLDCRSCGRNSTIGAGYDGGAFAAAAAAAGVQVVTGDTKVVAKGAADGVFVTTTGVGIIPAGRQLSAQSVRIGDRVLLSGSMGNHGMAVMLARGNLDLEADICSDTASISPLVEQLLAAAPSTRCRGSAERS